MNSENFQKTRRMKIFRTIFTFEFVVLLLWIPCVILIFKLIEDRKIAGLVAGTGFLLIPLFNILRERKTMTSMPLRLSRIIASGLFFFLSALPIFLYRVFNWEKNLEDISVLGFITGRQLHSLSNILFVTMVLIYLATNILDARKK